MHLCDKTLHLCVEWKLPPRKYNSRIGMPFDPLQIVGNTPGSQLSACTHTTAHTARPHIVHMIPASAESGIRTRKRHNFRTQPESEDSQRIERSRVKNAQMLRLLHPLLYNEPIRVTPLKMPGRTVSAVQHDFSARRIPGKDPVSAVAEARWLDDPLLSGIEQSPLRIR